MLEPARFLAASNLTTDPFRPNPDLDKDARSSIWVGYDSERRTLEKYLLDSRADEAGLGASSLVLLYGELGAGKTHACIWARHKLLFSEEAEAYNCVAYYIAKLRVGEKISFQAAFENDIIRKNNLERDVMGYKQFLSEVMIHFRREARDARLENQEVIERLIPSYDLADLADKLIACQGREQVMELLLDRAKGGDYKAVNLFTGLVRLFVMTLEVGDTSYRYKNAAYLFVDELNILADATAKEGRQVNELIRTIYDECSYAFCFVLAFTASVAALSTLFDQWVLDRVSKQIAMQVMPQHEAMEFIAGILDSNRVDSNNTSGRTRFYPFDVDAVRAIVSEMSSITPRKIMKVMSRVLGECRRAGADPAQGRITEDFLRQHGIMDEISTVPL
jgi:hypothetical protein